MNTLKNTPYKIVWHIDIFDKPNAREAIIEKYLRATTKPDLIVIDGFVLSSPLIDELRDLNIPVEPYRCVRI
jgi:hypothetical protein